MTATVRSYVTGTNWNSTVLFDKLEQAFADVGYLAQDDRGLAGWFTAATPTTIPGQASRRYLANPVSCSLFGAVSPSWVITRGNTGAVESVSAVGTGSGFMGRGYQIGTWSVSGTTVTVTTRLHGLTGTRRIYVNPSSVPAVLGGFQDALVLNENQIAFTISGSTGGTTSGSINIYAFAGSYQRINDVVTVTSPDHDLIDGSFVYATVVTGSLAGGLIGPITVVDSDVFSFPSVGATTSGSMQLRHTIKIDGSSIGGNTGTDDVYIAADQVGGICGSSTKFSWRGTTTGSQPYAMWKMRPDSSKKLGSQYVRLTWGSSSFLSPATFATWNPQTETTGSAGAETCGRDDTSLNAINSGTTSSLTIVSYQSELDPDFVVFTFTQANILRSIMIFHKFKPIASAPYTLDDLAHGSYTLITTGNDLTFSTFVSTSSITAERLYVSNANPQSSLYVTTTQIASTANSGSTTASRIFANQIFPTTINFGPLVNKIPINPLMIPSFYTMPDDFGIINVGAAVLSNNDTITVSPSEVYTVIRASYTTDKVAFVCRTT